MIMVMKALDMVAVTKAFVMITIMEAPAQQETAINTAGQRSTIRISVVVGITVTPTIACARPGGYAAAKGKKNGQGGGPEHRAAHAPRRCISSHIDRSHARIQQDGVGTPKRLRVASYRMRRVFGQRWTKD